MLEPTGKVESLARLARTGDDSFDLDTDAGYGEALAARSPVIQDRANAEMTTEPALSPEPTTEHEAARIAAGWPPLGFEIVPGETIPAVTGVVTVAVSFTKGCYPGQELVERMDSRGADAPRSLRISFRWPPVRRWAIRVCAHDGTDVGVLTSVSPTGGLAIALVKRGHDIGQPPPLLCDCRENAWSVALGATSYPRSGGRSGGGGGGEGAADRDDLGVLADTDQLR